MKKCILGILLIVQFWRATSDCDILPTPVLYEGNIGQTDSFSWLGVLRVKLPDYFKVNIAVSGVVLIHEKYALVNANDVAKIPEKIFRKGTTVMFLEALEVPWYCRPLNYSIHPEYEEETYNTIALLELDLDSVDYYPVQPICWFKKRQIESFQNLFAVGYSDENHILEKMIYFMQPTNKMPCDRFYKNTGLSDDTHKPIHYFCAFAKYARSECIWDNGMILVTNSSNYFTLLGFGIHGPGCAAPARFIALHEYYDWVNFTISSKTLQQKKLLEDFGPDNIPLHELFRSDDAEESLRRGIPKVYNSELFEPKRPKFFFVDELDAQTIVIYPPNGSYEKYEQVCESRITVVFKEFITVHVSKSHNAGAAYYKISLRDLLWGECVSVRISVTSPMHSTKISYKEQAESEKKSGLSNSEEAFFKNFIDDDIGLSTDKRKSNKSESILKSIFGTKKKFINRVMFVRVVYTVSATITIEMLGVKSVATTRRPPGRAFSVLTPEEERVEYLKMKSGRTPKPRKILYNNTHFGRRYTNGFIDIVPKIVFSNKSFKRRTTTPSSPFGTPVPLATLKFNRHPISNESQKYILKYIKDSLKPGLSTTEHINTNVANPVQVALTAFKGTSQPAGEPSFIMFVLIVEFTLQRLLEANYL